MIIVRRRRESVGDIGKTSNPIRIVDTKTEIFFLGNEKHTVFEDIEIETDYPIPTSEQ